jgi:hypothetical protein
VNNYMGEAVWYRITIASVFNKHEYLIRTIRKGQLEKVWCATRNGR